MLTVAGALMPFEMRNTGLMIKNVIKWFCAIYLFCFLLVAVHSPQGVWQLLRSGNLALPLVPLSAPMIIHSYGTLFAAGVWPWSNLDNSLKLEELIDTRGTPSTTGEGQDVVLFNIEDEFWPHGVNYFIDTEWYSYLGQNASVPQRTDGGVVQIGNYFCLSNGSRYNFFKRLFGPIRCVRLSQRGVITYWHELGNYPVREMRFR